MLNYLLAPTFQFTNTAGRPLSGGAYLEVYIHGTRTKYYCASDFEGNLHPFQIPLDSLGANVVLAEDSGSYDVYAYNRYGSLIMSRYNVKPGAGGGSGMGSITSSDGSIEVTPTSTGVDLKVNGQDPCVLRATANDLNADGSFTFSVLVIEGEDLSVDEHGRIRMEDGWYHYDATVRLVWENSVNDSATVQLYTTLNSDVMEFDLSYAHDETAQLGGEMKITTGGTSFVLGVSGLPNGMVAQLVDLGIHTITGHGGSADFEAGEGIVIDDHEISIDPSVVQEKLTAGDNIQISEQNVISATDTTYTAGNGLDLTGTEFSVDTSEVQEKLTAGSNVQISNENVISATDTTYTAGTGLDLTGTEFSVDTSDIQEKLTAGTNVQINGTTISATDTTYTAGTGLDLTGTEFSVDTSAIQEKLTAGSNITITNNVISAAADPQLQANWAESDTSSVQYIQNKPQNLVQDANYVHTDNNFTNADVIKLGGIEAGAQVNVQSNWNESNTSSDAYIQNKPDLSVYATDSELTAGLATKQDVISDLATIRSGAALGATATQPADLAAGLATKQDVISDLATIRSGAALGASAVQPGDLATVATTGSYEDLTDKPVIPAAQVQADWSEADSSEPSYIQNKPDLSVYATTSAMNTALAGKQDTLTAGQNITITNNVISATAAPQEQADWAEADSSDVSYIKNKPSVKPVVAGSNITITEGNDSFTISATVAQQVQADWSEADTTAADYIKNKPNLALKEDVANKKQSIDATSTTDYASSKAVADFVNSSVATATANFLGNYDLDDLGLTYPATTSQIETALDGYTFSTTPTNNDYVYVEVQNPQTTGIDDEVQRYKFNGTDWLYEYTLNNSSFTAAEKAAIDSGITSTDVSNYNAHIADTDIHVTTSDKSTWNAKQDAISDLSTIRSGAALGATAVQPGDLATVATTGSYTDLIDTPTIPAAQVNSDWAAASGVAQILNKPHIPVIGTITL